MPLVESVPALSDVRTSLPALRGGNAAWRELRAGLKGGTGDPATADALADRADQQMRLAEAPIAQRLGYAPCRWAWPPTVILRVDHLPRMSAPRSEAGAAAHEGPTCGAHAATPSPVVRTTPRSPHRGAVPGTETLSLR
jgi:hypothetical protein